MNVGMAEAKRERTERRRGFLLALPSFAYMVLFFAIPLIIVLVYSFATRTSTGSTSLSDWNFDAYRKLGRNQLRVGMFSSFTEAIGLGETDILFTKLAVVIGLVYAYLPFMILPLYASIDRLDRRLIEAGRDLYGSGPQTFRRVVLPLTMPGIIAGSILVFVPSMGAYVTPELLGGGKETLLGSYIVTQFLTARNWPVGASLSFVLMAVMLVSTVLYFRSGGKNL